MRQRPSSGSRAGRVLHHQPAGGRQRDDVGDVRRARRGLRARRRGARAPRLRHSRDRRRRSAPGTDISQFTTFCDARRRPRVRAPPRSLRGAARARAFRRSRRSRALPPAPDARSRSPAICGCARRRPGSACRSRARSATACRSRTARAWSSTSACARTRTMLITGGFVDAAEAAASGVVTRLAEPGGRRARRRRTGRGDRTQRSAHDSRGEGRRWAGCPPGAGRMPATSPIWWPTATRARTSAKASRRSWQSARRSSPAAETRRRRVALELLRADRTKQRDRRVHAAALNGTPAAARPSSTPPSVPISISSLKSPRCPMRNARPFSRPSPAPSDMLNRSSTIARNRSASWSAGHHDRRHDRAELVVSLAQNLEIPGAHGGARRLGQPPMAREHAAAALPRRACAAPRAGRTAGSSPASSGKNPFALAASMASHAQ